VQSGVQQALQPTNPPPAPSTLNIIDFFTDPLISSGPGKYIVAGIGLGSGLVVFLAGLAIAACVLKVRSCTTRRSPRVVSVGEKLRPTEEMAAAAAAPVTAATDRAAAASGGAIPKKRKSSRTSSGKDIALREMRRKERKEPTVDSDGSIRVRVARTLSRTLSRPTSAASRHTSATPACKVSSEYMTMDLQPSPMVVVAAAAAAPPIYAPLYPHSSSAASLIDKYLRRKRCATSATPATSSDPERLGQGKNEEEKEEEEFKFVGCQRAASEPPPPPPPLLPPDAAYKRRRPQLPFATSPPPPPPPLPLSYVLPKDFRRPSTRVAELAKKFAAPLYAEPVEERGRPTKDQRQQEEWHKYEPPPAARRFNVSSAAAAGQAVNDGDDDESDAETIV
jgi:hypothetical protein